MKCPTCGRIVEDVAVIATPQGNRYLCHDCARAEGASPECKHPTVEVTCSADTSFRFCTACETFLS